MGWEDGVKGRALLGNEGRKEKAEREGKGTKGPTTRYTMNRFGAKGESR